MDNVCHTLAGAALAESGLARRTALGYATLLIGANLPDLDVLAFLGGPLADLEWRRGWSHGVVALAVLPFLLTSLMLFVDRASQRMRRAVIPSEVRPGQLLLLSFVAIASHPVLDSLNTYGVRWLVPWSEDWSYGDTLFIIDPWVWIALGAGVWVSRKRRHARERNLVPEVPARRALLFTACYIAVMALTNIAARRIAAREILAAHRSPIHSLMTAPVPANPLARQVVVEQEDAYRVASFSWFASPRIDRSSIRAFPVSPPAHPAVAAAAATPEGRRFLGWARFPSFTIDSSAAGYVVHIVDLRYALRPGARFGSVSVNVGRSAASR
ncbi:MAG TPA: metal-dependent hydrolase [Gemmatimonadales bacterium]|nr:metal-dependent hydrolase [Gemmatimonadales bacterium]